MFSDKCLGALGPWACRPLTNRKRCNRLWCLEFAGASICTKTCLLGYSDDVTVAMDLIQLIYRLI